MGRVEGKRAIVTGAGSGIGEAIAQQLAREGAEVALVGRDEAKLRQTLARIEGKAHVYAADISSDHDVTALQQRIGERFGTVDILVNNAGTIMRNENMLETTDDSWKSFMNVNLLGPLRMCRAFVPFMIRQGKGAIVNVASQLSVVSAPGYATYSTAKGGIVSFTRSLAIDYGGHGIRANCVSPGVVETPMAYVGRDNFDAVKQSIADAHPLKRIGRPEDVAYAVLYLASDESGWVTGTNLLVDGGYTAR